MTVKEFYNLYIREEIPNLNFNDLVSAINIILQRITDLDMIRSKKVYYSTTNNSILLINTQRQDNNYTLDSHGMLISIHPYFRRFIKLYNPYGVEMRQTNNYVENFGTAGDNFYELNGTTLNFKNELPNLGVTQAAFDGDNGTIKVNTGYSYSIDGLSTGHKVLFSTTRPVYTAQFFVTVDSVDSGTIYFRERFKGISYSDCDVTLKPVYTVEGKFRPNKIEIFVDDSGASPSLTDYRFYNQEIDIVKGKMKLFSLMVLMELFSMRKYLNGDMLKIVMEQIKEYGKWARR